MRIHVDAISLTEGGHGHEDRNSDLEVLNRSTPKNTTPKKTLSYHNVQGSIARTTYQA